jgi:hypothetical protein
VRCKDHEDGFENQWRIVDEADEKGTSLVAPQSGGSRSYLFGYKKVIKNPDQKQFYEIAAKDTMKSFFQGYNTTLIAYGQS